MRISILLIGLVLIFTNCDSYESKFPITNQADDKIPDEYLGKWYLLDTFDQLILPYFNIEVLRFENEKDLLVHSYFKDREKKMIDYQKIWISSINGINYINAKYLRSSNPQHYFIHQFKMDENGTLNTTFLKDTFPFHFKKQTDFYNYIEDNTPEFNTYFHKNWITYSRQDSLKWGVVNSLWKDAIVEIYEINSAQLDTNFSSIPKNNFNNWVKKEFIKRDSFFYILENSYLQVFDPPNFKIPPKYFLIKLADGSYVKIAIGKFHIHDLTNDLGYIRIY